MLKHTIQVLQVEKNIKRKDAIWHCLKIKKGYNFPSPLFLEKFHFIFENMYNSEHYFSKFKNSQS